MPGITSDAASLPVVPIILSHCHLEWEKMIKGIVDTLGLPEDQTHLLAFSAKFATTWYIQNKYYSAKAQLIVLQDSWAANFHHIKPVAEAVIIYWDNTCVDSRQRLDTILDELGQFGPEVCLLVCDGFPENAKVSRHDANEWCIENGWELVELNDTELGSDEDSDSLEDDFVESRGFQRVQGALHANCWSNMKQVAGSVPLNSSAALLSTNDPFLGYEAPTDVSDEESEEEPNVEDVENFEDLFARFGEMRLTAASLSREDRLDYAEQVATAFLGAMGGEDEDETEDENIPEASNLSADTGDGMNGYSILLDAMDRLELLSERESEISAVPNDIPSEVQNISGLGHTETFGSTELLTMLGFPVIDPEESSDSSKDAVVSDGLPSVAASVEEAAVASSTDEFPVRTYEDIENELMKEELDKMLQAASATEEVRSQIQEGVDHSKKFRK